MARVRCITEMGMGVDVHGRDATKAAKRAVSDAIRHSSLGFFRMLGKTAKDMFVDVTIGVPDPGAVDTSAVAKELPYGTVTVTAVKGGLEIPAEQGGDAIIIANAAVIVSLDDGVAARRLARVHDTFYRVQAGYTVSWTIVFSQSIGCFSPLFPTLVLQHKSTAVPQFSGVPTICAAD